ncbi:MAG TPA: hypothetical protein VE077_00405 [Candidatus Methylomirabilis sp.]|nr:hypothetical protein [Candidatus Methylomirabilis sp.]
MARFVLRSAITKNILIAAALVSALACVQPRPAFAQRVRPIGGGHVGGPGRVVAPRVFAPPVSRPLISRPATLGPGLPGAGMAGFGFRRPFVPIFRQPIFLFVPPPFFAFRGSFYPLWWLNCGPLWGWEFGCRDLFVYPYAPEAYVTPPMRYESPVFIYDAYRGRERELVELYLKDGTVIGVTDYWFVGDKIHFIVPEEGGTKSVEQVLGLDELDLQTTIDVNTRRGFRFVKRDEPLQQYLRDHPDLDPPQLQLPPKN